MSSARRFAFLFLLLTNSLASAEATPLVVNTGFLPPVSNMFRQILDEAFKRLGRPLHFQEISAERSLKLVDEGIDDAECCRIPDVVLKDYRNLVTVPEPVFEVSFSAFVTDPAIRIENWTDLNPYSVGTVTGWKILVNNLNRIRPREFFILDNAQAMFRMLDMGRLEVATFGYLSGLQILRERQLQDNIRVVQPPLATRQLYLMLNRKHAALVPRLTEIIAELKADGTIDAIVHEISATP